jgi:5-methylcytosine-specific restriction endonuclease McrA
MFGRLVFNHYFCRMLRYEEGIITNWIEVNSVDEVETQYKEYLRSIGSSYSLRKNIAIFRKDDFTCQDCKKATKHVAYVTLTSTGRKTFRMFVDDKSGAFLTLDHIIPKHTKHPEVKRESNLQTLCRYCNTKKGPHLPQ